MKACRLSSGGGRRQHAGHELAERQRRLDNGDGDGDGDEKVTKPATLLERAIPMLVFVGRGKEKKGRKETTSKEASKQAAGRACVPLIGAWESFQPGWAWLEEHSAKKGTVWGRPGGWPETRKLGQARGAAPIHEKSDAGWLDRRQGGW